MKNKFIKLQDLDINDISKIEATTQSVVITLYCGDYINVNKKLSEVLSELGEKCI